MEVAEAGSFSLADFRAAVAAAARSERDHIIVAYSRKAFLQTGALGRMGIYTYGCVISLGVQCSACWACRWFWPCSCMGTKCSCCLFSAC